MQKKIKSLILSLPRPLKRLIVVLGDASIATLTVWLAFYLRLGQSLPLIETTNEFSPLPALVAGIFLSIPIFMVFGLYKAIFRHSGGATLIAVTKAIFFYGLIFSVIFTLITVPGVPRTIGIIQPILMLVFIGCSRFFARLWLGGLYADQISQKHIQGSLIYGAGVAGRELAAALKHNLETNVVGFLDDDVSLHGNQLSGLPVFDPADIDRIIKRKHINQVLLALPTAGRRRRNNILNSLNELGLAVRTVPSYSDLAKGRVSVNDIRELSIDDVLGRDEVTTNQKLISKDIEGKVVLVTGAGGSIGSELCLQVYSQKPKQLILFDHSEFALYNVYERVLARQALDKFMIEITPVLGSVANKASIEGVIKDTKPQIIFHSAAYKHVPLVESNKFEGLRNNVLGTLMVAQSAIKFSVAKFVLISTDKAVRPTNVMGASKRIAELVLQALSIKQDRTLFAIVRFGNVLGTSGSVLPLFQKQINSGGPVTVTHPDVTRYFMTVSEAVQLVIQASAMTGLSVHMGALEKSTSAAPVYLLDMGEPVRIFDLACRMIKLSGLSIFDCKTKEGDIEIKIIGLRPGEKLYEELLIGDSVWDSEHPKIKYADEIFLDWADLEPELVSLSSAIKAADDKATDQLLARLVIGFSPTADTSEKPK